MNESPPYFEKPRSNARILIYSHDTFGLGHLRRCREIAHALVEHYSGISVLIISGATIAGAFDYRSRVDFVKVPSVIKLRNGEYTSLKEHIPLADTLEMRRTIIKHTAKSFRPDIFIVDKEPVGLHGEIEEVLVMLKKQGTQLVLGLREVLDAPDLLAKEWAASNKMAKVQSLYDTIWVYGPRGFNDPFNGLTVPRDVRDRMVYTGFIKRYAHEVSATRLGADGDKDYILVTTGGGGDGADVIEQVLNAYSVDRPPDLRAIVTLGPYLPAREREAFTAKGEDMPNVQILDFDNRLEDLIAGALGVASMAGYNTFCEILSFDKPSLLLPRTEPREEQLIRAQRATEMGWASLLLPEFAKDPYILAKALRELPHQPRPSQLGTSVGMMNGLETIISQVEPWLGNRQSNDTTRAYV